MMPLLASLENSAFGAWVRESSSLWAYPTILFMHTVGLGFLVGLNVAIDLRILGVAPQLPLAPFERFYRIMWTAFWINTLSGSALLIADATTKLTNGVFYIKMTCILFAVISMVLIRRRAFRAAAPGRATAMPLRALAVASLPVFAGALTGGRLMAYFGPGSGAPGLQNPLP